MIKFINDEVVPKFNSQRIKEDQFAVLILSQRGINDILDTWLSMYHYNINLKPVDSNFIF